VLEGDLFVLKQEVNRVAVGLDIEPQAKSQSKSKASDPSCSRLGLLSLLVQRKDTLLSRPCGVPCARGRSGEVG